MIELTVKRRIGLKTKSSQAALAEELADVRREKIEHLRPDRPCRLSRVTRIRSTDLLGVLVLRALACRPAGSWRSSSRLHPALGSLLASTPPAPDAVRLALEAEFDVRAAALLVTEHLETAREPLVQVLLHIR